MDASSLKSRSFSRRSDYDVSLWFSAVLIDRDDTNCSSICHYLILHIPGGRNVEM